MKIGIYIFRRDLRLEDNIGLYALQKEVDIIIPIFILDEYQIKKSSHNVNYFSSNAVQFMCTSLVDLSMQLSVYDSYLRLFYGDPLKIINKLIKWIKSNYDNQSEIYLGYNCDYSKYALKRDKDIDEIANKYNINIIKSTDDYTLIPLRLLPKSDNVGFKQFGAFYKHAIKHAVNKPIKTTYKKYLDNKTIIKSEFNINDLNKFYIQNDLIAQIGGRSNALIILKNIKKYSDYNEMRDQLSYSTTNISAYLNFGCISIREFYHRIIKILGKNIQILKQLYWRDFYLQALVFLPDGNEYTHMDKRYDNIKWKNSKSDWDSLINCRTGFLLVDAAMNEMKTTGIMHNRARMIVGVFWTKYLLIDIFHPIYGSQVGYSKYLVDAVGPSQNKLNHQWITEFDYAGKKFAPSVAPIAGRPMDISNRMILKWDKECLYIKKWLPHLAHITPKELYKWNPIDDNIHPAPMFDPKVKYKEWIQACTL
jgi:deoxyribodipyrimidine photo-lyase